MSLTWSSIYHFVYLMLVFFGSLMANNCRIKFSFEAASHVCFTASFTITGHSFNNSIWHGILCCRNQYQFLFLTIQSGSYRDEIICCLIKYRLRCIFSYICLEESMRKEKEYSHFSRSKSASRWQCQKHLKHKWYKIALKQLLDEAVIKHCCL